MNEEKRNKDTKTLNTGWVSKAGAESKLSDPEAKASEHGSKPVAVEAKGRFLSRRMAKKHDEELKKDSADKPMDLSSTSVKLGLGKTNESVNSLRKLNTKAFASDEEEEEDSNVLTVIPDIGEEKYKQQDTIFIPHNLSRGLPTLSELQKGNKLSSLPEPACIQELNLKLSEPIDISLLTRYMHSNEELEEPDEVWDVDELLDSLVGKI